MGQIRILIVEDSLVERELLVGLFSADPDIQVLGAVNSGLAALIFLEQHKPDVITMDITMPHMDGYETARRIMETCPIPIVMVSGSWNSDTVEATFRAMEAGVVAGMEKPPGVGHPRYQDAALQLIQTVKSMAEVKVVRRWARSRRLQRKAGKVAVNTVEEGPTPAPGEIGLVAIGSSTGGPAVLQTVLSQLQEDFPLPVVITQHIAPGFLSGLAKWLEQTTGRMTHIATQGERLLPGHVYLAPDGYHTGVDRNGTVVLSKDAPEHGMRPAVSHLFRSVASTFGKYAIGVLLTGMGRDGAEELKLMKDLGALTIAQDEESSVVYGMPGEAVKLGGATYVLPPEKIAATLNSTLETARRTARPKETPGGGSSRSPGRNLD
jgi:two-component system chemotaxis response regulator CheB